MAGNKVLIFANSKEFYDFWIVYIFFWRMFLRFLGRFFDFLPTLFHSNKDVVRLIFEYIKMLQRLEPNKRYWKERLQILSFSVTEFRRVSSTDRTGQGGNRIGPGIHSYDLKPQRNN